MDKNKELSFEESLKELENIVDQLESGDIDLEKSVKLYEKGMLLKKKCENNQKEILVTSTEGIYKKETNSEFNWLVFTPKSWQIKSLN